jgi:hypothetical protein
MLCGEKLFLFWNPNQTQDYSRWVSRRIFSIEPSNTNNKHGAWREVKQFISGRILHRYVNY